MKAGNLPQDLGLVDMISNEMMCWLYCPIKIPYGPFVIPDNLKQFKPILEAISLNEYISGRYVYITVKNLWVQGTCNRPGWHCDGFGSEDINYLWYDRVPTEFVHGDEFELPEDCAASLEAMDKFAQWREIVTYPNKHLLRLDPTVIHRCAVEFEPGMRSFVKISISKNMYDLEGNSINHNLPLPTSLKPRKADRNHPSTATTN